MISKIVIAAAVLAVAVAQHNIGYGHGHGHAVSSQNIVLHQTHGRVQHAPVAHHAPVIAHAPVVHYQPTHHASHDGHHVDYHASAQYDHGHGQAVSSQNIVLHQTHGHVQHAPVIAHHAYQPAVVLQHQPAHYVSKGHNEDYHAPAHYSFEYSVSDPHTGDIKSQKESREGDAVHGSYSLHEADGTIRRVEYTADKHSGFNAVVHREGKATHAAPSHHQPSHHSHH